MAATAHAIALVRAAARAASDKLAANVLAFDVSDQLIITDAFLICSGANDRQVGAIVDAIEERLRLMDAKPSSREGVREARWVLLDYLDIVVHVQRVDEYEFYALERVWRDCPLIPLPEPVTSGRGPAESDAR